MCIRGASAISDVRIRPHHLLCIQGFRGQGYSPKFIANLARVIDRLDKNPHGMVKIVAAADDICSSCPHLSHGACACPDQNVERLDRQVLERLGYADGQKATWDSIVENICATVNPGHIRELCTKCRWLDLEYCSRGLQARCGVSSGDGFAASAAD